MKIYLHFLPVVNWHCYIWGTLCGKGAIWPPYVEVKQYTVKCRYNAVQFIPILHTVLRKQRQKVNKILESQQTSHISPSRASYGVSFVKIMNKIDCVITAPHCIQYNISYPCFWTCWWWPTTWMTRDLIVAIYQVLYSRIVILVSEYADDDWIPHRHMTRE